MKSFENPQEQKHEDERLQSRVEVVRDENGKTSNVFVTEKDIKFDLYEFLPEGVAFVGSDHFRYGFQNGDPNSKDHPPLVIFPQNEANSVQGRLSILHEMGHAIDAERDHYQSIPYEDLQYNISRIVRSIRQSEEYDKLEDQKSKEDYVAQEFQKAIKSYPVPESDEAILSALKFMARSERSAWANALRLYRKIKKEKGVDLLDGVSSKEMFKIVEDGLGSYQDTYGILVPEQQVKLFLIKKYSLNSRA